MTFAKEGKVTLVNILNERKIGEGTTGTTYETDVLVGGRKRKFIIKRFKGSTVIAKKNTVRAIENYQMAKKAGLKVFPTYRLGEDGTSILMTNANVDSTICVDTLSYSSLPSRGGTKIEIDDDKFEKLANGVFQQAGLAAKHGIYVPVDTFFFLINTETKDVDFVLGDLDTINNNPIPESAPGPNIRLVENLGQASIALQCLVLHNIENAGSCYARLREVYHKIRS